MRSCARAFFGLIVGSVVSFSAHATPVITAVGSSIIANGATAPGSATDYDFFGATTPAVLTNFTVSTGSTNIFASGSCCGYSQITAPGGSTLATTGIAYAGSGSNGTLVLLASFSPDAAGNFTVYILDANADGNNLLNMSVSLGVNGGSAVSIATCGSNSTCVGQKVDEFTQFTVTGASAGDVFQIYATSDGERPSIGGVSFAEDIAATPEPASITLTLTGLCAMAFFFRRRLAL